MPATIRADLSGVLLRSGFRNTSRDDAVANVLYIRLSG
jgi:hypothetical protein